MLSQDAPQAPDDVWENLSSQLDMDAAKMRLNTEEEGLIEEVWAGLENQLDIDEVWGNISGELDKTDQKATGHKFKFPYWAAAAMLLLLLMGDTGLIHFLSNGANTAYMADVKIQQDIDSLKVDVLSGSDIQLEKKIQLGIKSIAKDNIDNVLTSSSDFTSSKKHVTESSEAFTETEEHKPNNNSNILLAQTAANHTTIGNDKPQQSILKTRQTGPMGLVSIETGDSYLVGKDVLAVKRQEFKPELKPVLTHPKITDDYRIYDLDVLLPADKKPDLLAYNKKYSPWSTGIVTSLKNTYLLNAETKEGFSSTGMNESKITVLPDIGLNVQYAINPRYVLSSNLFLSSTSKQNYNTYNHGEYVSKQLKLNYLATEFAIKQSSKNNIFDHDKIMRRNIVGFYVAALQSASETLVEEKSDISSKYTALDYGLLLGQEIEFVSRGPIKVSAGLTFKYGLPNVYAGDSALPGNLNQTHNASFEFRVVIAYRWKTNRGFDHYLSFLNGR